jgi:hypothetical protein
MRLHLLLGLILFVQAVAWGTMSVLHIQDRIPPNQWAGLRVAKTLNNPAVWYQAHRRFGWGLLLASGTMLIGATCILMFRDSWSRNLVQALFLLLTLVPPICATIYGVWYLRKL